jgi:hypothetical protein
MIAVADQDADMRYLHEYKGKAEQGGRKDTLDVCHHGTPDGMEMV